MDGTITLLILVVIKKTVYPRILLAKSRQKKLLENKAQQENRGFYRILRHQR